MPKRQMVSKTKPVNSLCIGTYIGEDVVVKVDMARRIRPENEAPTRKYREMLPRIV